MIKDNSGGCSKCGEWHDGIIGCAPQPVKSVMDDGELREQLVELSKPYIDKLVKVTETLANGGIYRPHNPNGTSLVDAIMQLIKARDEQVALDARIAENKTSIKNTQQLFHTSAPFTNFENVTYQTIAATSNYLINRKEQLNNQKKGKTND